MKTFISYLINVSFKFHRIYQLLQPKKDKRLKKKKSNPDHHHKGTMAQVHGTHPAWSSGSSEDRIHENKSWVKEKHLKTRSLDEGGRSQAPAVYCYQ